MFGFIVDVNLLNVVTLSISLSTLIFLIFEFKRKRKIEKIEFFLKFRIRLKEDQSLVKITKFITDCEVDNTLCDQIPTEITAFDLYYFLGFIEELSFVKKHKIVDINMIDDMFGFYILAVADNPNIWKKFNEDIGHSGWKNFRELAAAIKERRKN